MSRQKDLEPIFSATESGFFMRFENGWGISVQWKSRGGLHLCSAQNLQGDFVQAEVGVFNQEGDMIQLSTSDTILGWQSTDDVASLISKASMGRLG